MIGAGIIQANALAIPMANDSVDLVVTSPPYWALRSYRDGDAHYDGQIGSEVDPLAFVDALLTVTVEIVRVLKPTGSLWVNLGDKYANDSKWGGYTGGKHVEGLHGASGVGRTKVKSGMPAKSLIGIPWRYALGCIDQLGLILRAEVVWNKPNGLPESVKDRVRRNHEQWFHFTKEPRYFSAVDEIRESHTMRPQRRPSGRPTDQTPRQGQPRQAWSTAQRDEVAPDGNVLGKTPGSVWSIPTEPLIISQAIRQAHDLPAHFAAFPQELPRKIILGWSPAGVCTACDEGRRPVTAKTGERGGDRDREPGGGGTYRAMKEAGAKDTNLAEAALEPRSIVGYACACTPRTSHRGKQGDWKEGRKVVEEQLADDWHSPGASVPRRPGGFGTKVPTSDGEWEYHLNGWVPPPTRPGVVLDPFVGTGTTLGVARALGRFSVGLDLSFDYARLSRWRVFESGHFSKTVERTNAERQGSLL